MIVNKLNPEVFDVLVPLLRDGGTAIIPCDTIYGLCAIYELGEKALFNIKSRNHSKRFLVLATKEQAISLTKEIPEPILNVWPAPLTVILKAKKSDTTIAIRVPDDGFLLNLLNKLGKPIYSTSVNISGEPELLDFTSICKRFEAIVDIIIKGPEIQGTIPSTLIDVTTTPYKIIRKGVYDASFLISKSGLSNIALSK